MPVTKLLAANLTLGLTTLFQTLVPTSHIVDLGAFWMFATAEAFLVVSVIIFIGLLLMRRSKCSKSMGKKKLALYHSPTIATTAISMAFFVLYTCIAEVANEQPAIQNAVLLLIVAVGLMVIISIVILLVSFYGKLEKA